MAPVYYDKEEGTGAKGVGIPWGRGPYLYIIKSVGSPWPHGVGAEGPL